MDRYLPITAALLALPHLLSIAASSNAPTAAASAHPPRAVSAPAVVTAAHCAMVSPRVQAVARAPSRTGVVGFAQQSYLRR
ncbi:hypothetical protein K4L06_16755 [Lysobacter sp. BMK333-48F3]|uniref:hypothetical protein n=1 Tax=Lysobacter sp. BMK333-48F3 TaxID=2867962 RepID=UPI001C8C11C6|nr:hypothetical protein [Lysobacter sp. BMK333-48F3]MBX9402962.1 hypothetical protein [Lysobacter sp. BMK333-48F3]